MRTLVGPSGSRIELKILLWNNCTAPGIIWGYGQCKYHKSSFVTAEDVAPNPPVVVEVTTVSGFIFSILQIVKYLVEKGAKLDVYEEYNITPVFSASQYGQLDCLKLLLEEAAQRGISSFTDTVATLRLKKEALDQSFTVAGNTVSEQDVV